MDEWKRTQESRGQWQNCLPEVRRREEAIRLAHRLYEEEYGKTSKLSFCLHLMDLLGCRMPFMEKAKYEPLKGDKDMILTCYKYALEQVK